MLTLLQEHKQKIKKLRGILEAIENQKEIDTVKIELSLKLKTMDDEITLLEETAAKLLQEKISLLSESRTNNAKFASNKNRLNYFEILEKRHPTRLPPHLRERPSNYSDSDNYGIPILLGGSQLKAEQISLASRQLQIENRLDEITKMCDEHSSKSSYNLLRLKIISTEKLIDELKARYGRKITTSKQLEVPINSIQNIFKENYKEETQNAIPLQDFDTVTKKFHSIPITPKTNGQFFARIKNKLKHKSRSTNDVELTELSSKL